MLINETNPNLVPKPSAEWNLDEDSDRAKVSVCSWADLFKKK